MLNVTVAAKFLTHAKIKYMELWLTNFLSLGLMYVKKFTSFCQVLKRRTQKKTGSFFLPHCEAIWEKGCFTQHLNIFEDWEF